MTKQWWLSLLAVGLVMAMSAAEPVKLDDAELVETRTAVPKLLPAGTYQVVDNTVTFELCEYSGYAGLIVANGGLEPNDNSLITKKYGFKVRLTKSEEENWSPLNAGKIAGAATTADVLAVYGSQLSVTVPALISFSRGADGVVVNKEIARFNDLAGKVVSCCQFTESDFYIRYLAQSAGMKVHMLESFADKPQADAVNLIYCADGAGAGDLYLRDLLAGKKRLAGCVTWDPKTGEVAKGSNGKATVLTTTRNLLMVADIMVFNKGFAKAHPQMVEGLLYGLLKGNQMVRAEPDKYLKQVGDAFGWDTAKTKGELAKVHLANLPENQAFFAGTIDAAGSFGYICDSAALAYGEELLPKPADPQTLMDLKPLAALAALPDFKDEKAAIAPVKLVLEGVPQRPPELPLLKKDLIFAFSPDSAKLENSADNTKKLTEIKQMLRVSPGAHVLLRGHADGSQLDRFRKEGGEDRYREARMALLKLSKARCAEIRALVTDDGSLDVSRLEYQAIGVDEPTGKGPAADRRVEVQWFTVE